MPSVSWLPFIASGLEGMREIAPGSPISGHLSLREETLLVLREKGQAACIPISHLHRSDLRKD